MLHFASDYIRALFHYWWVMVIGLFGAINTFWKWFHPNRKDIAIPHWLRVGIAVGAVIAAQILVHHDSISNLNHVIDDKKLLASENWQLKHTTVQPSSEPTLKTTEGAKPTNDVEAAKKASGGVTTGSITQGAGSIAQIGGSGNSATLITATHPIPHLSSFPDDRTDVRNGHPMTFVKIKLDGLFDNPRFAVICDRPCKGVELGVSGHSQLCNASIPGKPNFGVIYPIAPNPFPAFVEAEFGVSSEDDVPVKILAVKTLTLTNDKGCTP
jgi:hypothetical protein